MSHTPPEVEKAAFSQEDVAATTLDKHEVLHNQQANYDVDLDEPELHWRTHFVVIAACVAYFAQIYSLTATGTWLQEIKASLGDADRANWVPNANQIVLCTIGPGVAFCSDIVGRRWFVLVTMAFGFVGSIIVAKAQSMNMAIAGAVVFGGAFVGQPLIHASMSRLSLDDWIEHSSVPSEVLPRRYRSGAQSALNFSSALGGIVALLGGGGFVKHNALGGWRGVYWLQTILYGFSMIVFAFMYRPAPRPNLHPEKSKLQQCLEFDYIGSALLAAFVIPFLMGLLWLNNPYPSDSAHVIAPIVIGLIFGIAFGLWEWKGTSTGLLNHRLFQHRSMPIALFLIFVEGFLFFGINIFFNMETAILFEHDPFNAALHFLPFWIALTIMCPIIAFVSQRYRIIKEQLVIGFILFTGAVIGFLTLNPEASTRSVVFVGLAGMGFSTALVLIMVVAQLFSPADLLASCSAVILVGRALGGVIGTAAYSAVFNTKINKKLPEYIASAVLPLGVNPQYLGAVIGAASGGDAAALAQIPGVNGNPQIIGAAFGASAKAFSDSFRYVWAVLLPFCAVGIVLSALIEPVKERMNYLVDVPAEKLERFKHHEHK